MIKQTFINADKDGNAPTVVAGYYKFGSQTILTDYTPNGGGYYDRI